MTFGNQILKYKKEMLEDLDALLKIESIAGLHDDECRRALDFMLNRAEDFGLITKNVDGVAGHAQLGDNGKLCAVLTHLDVVPQGNNWSVMPFELTQRDGRLYGRGVADDKGAAIAVLYGLRALKESGITGKNTLRAIFGTNEERGMTDMDAYFKSEAMPDISFTPDSDYGVCRAEKGILQFELYANEHTGTTLNELHSGSVVNQVPDTAYAMLDCSEEDDHQLLRLADASDGTFEFHYTIDGLMILSRGKSAHACQPAKGYNAAMALINLLCSNFSYQSLGELCTFLNCRISNEINGNSLGIKMRDSLSGPLTVNVGTVHIGDSYATATIDIRYPVTMDGSTIATRVINAAKQEGLTAKLLTHNPPLNVDKNSPLITLLKESYLAVTGKEPELYSTGGGTYARKLGGNGVAFGPVFPGDESNMHNADESLDENNYLLHSQICLEAMYRMFTCD